jgi:hypothetical protein
MEDVQVLEDEKELTIIIPRKGNALAAGIAALWCGVLLYSTFQVIRDRLLFRDAGFTIPWLLFLLAAIVIFDIFLWNIHGREKVSLTSNHLKISKLGTMLSFPNRYESNLVNDFRVNNEATSWWKSFYGFSGGTLVFTYWGDRHEFFGQTVSGKTATYIVQRLNDRLAKIKSTIA